MSETAHGAGSGADGEGARLAAAGLPVLEDLGDVDGLRVLVRVDFNVPLEEHDDGTRTVADDFRIKTALPTLEWLKAHGAKVTACSHLGRPADAPDPRWDMEPVREALAAACPGVSLLENLRFSPGERANDPAFVDELVEGQDAYVDEAFSAAHRAHASIVGPPARLPSAAGRQLAREVEVLGGLMAHPDRPFVAVVGGAKVADKLGVLEALAAEVDALVVGGAMAFTFLAAQGRGVGDSPVDDAHLEDCRTLLASGVPVLLPTDVVVLASDAPFGAGVHDQSEAVSPRVEDGDIGEGWRGLDIGPQSADVFRQSIVTAATVLWNGPMGVVEDERFADGTRRVADAVAACPGMTVVGGGDSVSAVRHLGVADRIGFLSTGGGATLEFVEKGDLPGLAALRAAPNAARR